MSNVSAHQVAFCPNCSAELATDTPACWNCRADFGSESAWRPTDKPLGTFRSFSAAKTGKAEWHPIFDFLFRMVLAVFAWLALGVFALLSAVPYGGGSKELFAVFWVSAPLLLIWAVMPLGRLFTRNQRKAGVPQNER